MFFGAFLLCIAMSNAAQLTFFPNSTTSGSPGSSTSSSGTKTSSADAASSSDEGYPICRTGDPYMTLWAFNPYDTSNFPNNIVPPNTALANYCSADWSRSFAEYISTAPVTTSTAVEVTTTTNSDAQITSFTTTEVDVWYNGPAFSYPTKSPCCLNCTLFGGTVQVYYWPTAAPNATAPPVTALVDRNNHTFVSPTVYVAFDSLYATDGCGQVGPSVKATTIGFHPDELSTSASTTWIASHPLEMMDLVPQAPFFSGNWAKDLIGCTISTSVVTRSFSLIRWPSEIWGYCRNTAQDHPGLETHSYYSASSWTDLYTDTVTITYDYCTPFLGVPTSLFDLYSHWRSCVPGVSAFLDPPFQLQENSANGLSAFSPPEPTPAATAVSDTTSTTTASPAASPVDPTPSSTSTAAAADPTNATRSSSDPTSSDPSSSPKDDPTTQATDPTLPSTTQSSTDPAPANNDPTPQSKAVDPPAPSPSNNEQTSNPAATNPTVGGSTPTTTSVSNIWDPAFTDPGQILSSGTSTASSTIPLFQTISNSQSLVAGGSPTTIAGTVYSLQAGGSSIVVGGSTQNINSFTGLPAVANYQVGSQTLAAGAAVTVAGTTYSLQTGGSSVVVDGSKTVNINSFVAAPTVAKYQVGGSTLVAGAAPITVSGTIYSLQSGGSSIVVGGTRTVNANAFASPSTTQYLLGSQTLVAGAAAITVSGETISLQAGGASVVIDGSTTQAISAFITTAAGGSVKTVASIGGIIASLGGFPTPTSSYIQVGGTSNGSNYNGTMFLGVGSRKEVSVWVWGFIFGLGVFGMMIL